MSTFNYQEYLASREWAIRKRLVRMRAKDICERCERSYMQSVHHLTYANIGNEPLWDLLAVCPDCHDYLNGGPIIDPAKGLRAVANSRDEWGQLLQLKWYQVVIECPRGGAEAASLDALVDEMNAITDPARWRRE